MSQTRPFNPELMTVMARDLVEALAELQNAPKDSKADTGKFSYGYASLPAILDLVRPVLASHGFVVTQETLTDGAFVGVRTRLHHTSGEVLTFGPLFLPAGQNAQTAGSAITYARRYALSAALGIAADEDDDGKKASAPPTAQAGNESPPSLRARGAEGAVPGTKVPASPAAAPISSTVADAGIESDGGPSPSEGAPASPGGDSSSAAPVGPGTEAEGARQDPVGNGEGPAGTEGSPQPPNRRNALWKQLVEFSGSEAKARTEINSRLKTGWTWGNTEHIPEDDIENTLKAVLQEAG